MINTSIKQFRYYKQLADKTIEQLSEADLFHIQNENENSIAIIIQHMVGNMKSRWTNFLTEDGEKNWRNRDQEFEDQQHSKESLLEIWEKGWELLFVTLNNLSENDLSKKVQIRNESLTVQDAIIRQLCHYSYHVGQIVSKGKQLADENWKCLSIPKNKSNDYNFKKFSQIQDEKHYLDKLIDEGK